MKKIIFLFFTVLMLFNIGVKVFAVEKISTIGSSATIYYSPGQGWFKTTDAADKIKVVKTSNKYYVDNKLAFTIDSDFNFISNNTFVTVNNKKLKFYTPKYEDGKFIVEEMTPDEVQVLFSGIHVIPVSKFENGGIEIKRVPYTREVYLLVNDTERDFTGYGFSPVSAHKTDIAGIFVARRSANIRYLTERMDRDNCLSMYIRIDENAYDNSNVIFKGDSYTYDEYKIFEEI